MFGIFFYFFFHGADKAGYQTVTLYLNFFLNLIYVAVFCRNITLEKINAYFTLISFTISILYLYVIVSNGVGQSGIIGRRSFALEAVILLSWFGMQTKLGPIAVKCLIWVPFLLILLSLSRTAILLSIIVIFLRIMRRKSESNTFTFRKFALTLVLSLISLTALIQNSSVFRERVTGGDRAFRVGGYSISSQGRNRIWNTILDDSNDSQWIGKGPGSVRALISERIPGQTEPHNEFLRIFYESGGIGLAFFGAGVISIAILLFRNQGKLDELRFSTLVATICFLVLAVTDNPSVYIFVVLPISTILGIYIARLANLPK